MNQEALIRRSAKLAKQPRANANHPFGALFCDAAGNILLEAENTVMTEKDCTGHAETNLMRKASQTYSCEFSESCTVVTSTEPCSMCSGAIYWANVKQIIYGLRESQLLALTGENPENPTLSLPSSHIYKLDQINISVIGPILEDEARVVHDGFWEQIR